MYNSLKENRSFPEPKDFLAEGDILLEAEDEFDYEVDMNELNGSSEDKYEKTTAPQFTCQP